jgi:hypothetical protein
MQEQHIFSLLGCGKNYLRFDVVTAERHSENTTSKPQANPEKAI